MTAARPALPSYGDDVRVVVPAPGPGAGNWAGAASADLVDGVYWLTWRVRRPVSEGRGVTVVVARSADGETFEQVAVLRRCGIYLAQGYVFAPPLPGPQFRQLIELAQPLASDPRTPAAPAPAVGEFMVARDRVAAA